MRSLASSPSMGSPTAAWMNRHSASATSPAISTTSRNLPKGCSASLANAPVWLTSSLDVSPTGELDGEDAEDEVQDPTGGDAGPAEGLSPTSGCLLT